MLHVAGLVHVAHGTGWGAGACACTACSMHNRSGVHSACSTWSKSRACATCGAQTRLTLHAGSDTQGQFVGLTAPFFWLSGVWWVISPGLPQWIYKNELRFKSKYLAYSISLYILKFFKFQQFSWQYISLLHPYTCNV